MITSTQKPIHLRVRVYDADLEDLAEIAKNTLLPLGWVAQILIHAGLEAIRKNKNKFTIPLVFTVGD